MNTDPAHIQELTRKVEHARHVLYAAELELKEARVVAAGIKIDDIVLHNNIEHKVTHINATYDLQKPWLRGRYRRKDGSWSNHERHLYTQWEKKA